MVSGPDFFLYDLSWAGFCNGDVPQEKLEEETGIMVNTLSDLRQAMAGLFEKYGPMAIAVKAREEQEKLEKKVAALEKEFKSLAPAPAKPRKKPAARK